MTNFCFLELYFAVESKNVCLAHSELIFSPALVTTGGFYCELVRLYIPVV